MKNKHKCPNCTDEQMKEREKAGKSALPCVKCGMYYPGDCRCTDCCCDGCITQYNLKQDQLENDVTQEELLEKAARRYAEEQYT